MLQDSFHLFLKRKQLDLVHKPNPTGFFLPLGLPTVVTVHDLSYVHYQFLSHSLHQFLYSQSVKKTLNNCQAIIADSEYTKKDVVQTFGVEENKINVIYLSADSDFKVLRLQEIDSAIAKKYGKNFILYVGTIEPRKNIINLILAFEILKTKGLDTKLVLVGKTGYKSGPIYQRINQSPFKEAIIIPGFVEKHELINLYNLACFFVYPSLYEGFGLPILEAMSCGCPVVTSNVSSMPEVVGKAGIKVDPYDIHKLARTMKDLFLNKDLRKKLIQEGFKQKEKYAWQKCAQKTLKIYEKIGKRK